MAALASAPPIAAKPSRRLGLAGQLLILVSIGLLAVAAHSAANIYFWFQQAPGARGSLAQMVVIDLLLPLIALALVVTATVMVAQRLSKPILEAASYATQVSTGELPAAELPPVDSAELDLMVRSINDMVAYIRELSAVAECLATGDLTVQVRPRSEGDVLGQAFQKMVGNMHQLATELTSDALAVAEASDSLYRVSLQANEAAAKIAQSADLASSRTSEESDLIARIADGQNEQRRSVMSSSETVSQMSSAIERVVQNAQGVAEASDSAYRAANDGAEKVRQAAFSMNSIRDSVVQSASQLRQMGSTSKQISDISEIIGDIAEETQHLALNASIEAARAGEQGKGFAVVAGEVGKLATRSSSATSQISELATKILEQTRDAIHAMEQGVARVEEGSDLAARAAEALQSILMAVRRTNDQIQAISTIAEQMSASSSQVVGAINRISQVVVQNSEQTEQMSQRSRENIVAADEVQSATRRVSDQVGAIHDAAEQLKSLSASLKAAAESFTL